MRVADRMREKLTRELSPERLEIIDESSMHAGHAGARPGGETHFRLTVVAAAFEGLSRIDRQRRVYDVLADEMRGEVHALSAVTLTPAEAERQG